LDISRALVTGGAGFIGSHIVERLVNEGVDVTVYDNLSSGFEKHLKEFGSRVRFIKGDILETARLTRAMEGCDTVFHLAANADVRGGVENTLIDLHQNVLGTHSVLEAIKHTGGKTLAFASSATVYGEPDTFPTPESSELVQTSVYGASKASGEAYIQAYSEYYEIRTFSFRFVSWIGERYSHGVIYDFVKKLFANSTELEILGDGKQKKSYLYVKDGVSGIFSALEHSRDRKNTFNLGHDSWIPVVRVADIICEEMGLANVSYSFTGGERGWIGDSPFVHLDTARLNALGWKPRTSIEDGVRSTVRYLLNNPEIFQKRG
jgi:UDP-glucose 4-epimerase